MKQTVRISLPPITAIMFLMVVQCACETNDEESVKNDELIFPYSKEIRINPYYYSESSFRYHILGDSIHPASNPDTVSCTPVICWQPEDSGNIVIAAVFNSPISTDESGITNEEDICWIWHSGSGTGSNGRVEFGEGFRMGQNLDEMYPPEPLIENRAYFWGIWAFDPSGMNVKYSSRMHKFYTRE